MRLDSTLFLLSGLQSANFDCVGAHSFITHKVQPIDTAASSLMSNDCNCRMELSLRQLLLISFQSVDHIKL
jgi:hypothetical protein